MNLIKYFTYQYRLLIYATMAALFSVLIANLVNGFNLQTILPLFSISLTLVYIMRTADDIHDYASDRRKHKKHFLTKNGLMFLLFVLQIIYIFLNFFCYGPTGGFALLLLGIIFVWEAFPVCKVLFLPLSYAIFALIISGETAFRQYDIWCYLVIFLLISCAFYAYKRGGK